MVLADLYDGDKRARDPEVLAAASKYRIPHPLASVKYADGTAPATAGRDIHSPWINEKEL